MLLLLSYSHVSSFFVIFFMVRVLTGMPCTDWRTYPVIVFNSVACIPVLGLGWLDAMTSVCLWCVLSIVVGVMFSFSFNFQDVYSRLKRSCSVCSKLHNKTHQQRGSKKW